MGMEWNFTNFEAEKRKEEKAKAFYERQKLYKEKKMKEEENETY